MCISLESNTVIYLTNTLGLCSTQCITTINRTSEKKINVPEFFDSLDDQFRTDY